MRTSLAGPGTNKSKQPKLDPGRTLASSPNATGYRRMAYASGPGTDKVQEPKLDPGKSAPTVPSMNSCKLYEVKYS
jgi:hypothetical protein